MEKETENQESVLILFKTAKKKIFYATLLNFAIVFIAIAISGLQLFYPYHFIIGFGVYLISFWPLYRRISLTRKTWMKFREYDITISFFKREKFKIILVAISIVIVFAYFFVRPMDANPFRGLEQSQIQTLVQDDLYTSITAMDYLESTGNELLESIHMGENDANDSEILLEKFGIFLDAVTFSESLTEVHRYFDYIPDNLENERKQSFIISYSLYIKKYEILHRIMTSVSGSEYHKKVLDQYNPTLDRSGMYSEMTQRFYHPKTRVRITGGFIYLDIILKGGTDESNEVYQFLTNKAKLSYEYLLHNFDKTLIDSVEVVADSTRNRMFDLWMPIQKGVANSMGRAIISTRGHNYFITPDQIDIMEESMIPGDIMLQRRNWHLSNVGIPGFWTHAALYVGSLEMMDVYFKNVFPFEGYASLSEYLQEELPEIYEELQTEDADGRKYAVIEAIEPGVVLQSLAKSAHADFIVVLRPRLTKKDALYAIIKAFENRGKPYDYNFDFDTRDAMVCSELLYDAYFENLPEKNGLHLETSLINGRKIVSPLDIAKKYKSEKGTDNRELDFVYFLEGSENDGKAFVSTEEVFLESIDWSKFSFIQ